MFVVGRNDTVQLKFDGPPLISDAAPAGQRVRISVRQYFNDGYPTLYLGASGYTFTS